MNACYHINTVTCQNCRPRVASACPHCTPRCPHGYPFDTAPWQAPVVTWGYCTTPPGYVTATVPGTTFNGLNTPKKDS
jgi:hypothetical protein